MKEGRPTGAMFTKAMVVSLGIIGCLMQVAAALSNEGTEFAVVCTPAVHSSDACELILSARQTTDVTITTASFTDTITVYRNWTHHYQISYSMRPETGIENKGIYLSSTEPIVVHIAVSTIYDNHTPDTALARPHTDSAREYFLASYHNMATTQYRPMAFYVIVATEDDTEVDVFYPDTEDALPDEHLTLNRYEVFTRDCYLVPGSPRIDFTGTRIVSSKPTTVFGGNGQAYIHASGAEADTRHLMDSMPSSNELGREYITFPMHFGGIGGYEVRVIAVADDTAVTVPVFSTSVTLHAGQFHVIDNTDTQFGFRVSCSKPCMVMQYVRSLPAGGPTGLLMSGFLATLVPEERVSHHLIFAVPTIINHPSYDMVAAISIIVNTYPVTDLFLNDTSLDTLSWETVQNSSSCYATTDITGGFYQLYSTSPLQRFTAYMYLLRTDSSYPGFGTAIGYGERFPPGGDVPPIPHYRFVLLGNFTSLDGSDFSQECTQALQQSFYDKADSLVPLFNSMVGNQYCTYVEPGSVEIISVVVTMVTDGTAGYLDTAYLLESELHVTISNFTTCTREISKHMEDFDSWGRPIVPPVEGCPRLAFDPDYFFEQPDGRDWVCRTFDLDSKYIWSVPQEVGLYEVEAPLYSISIFDNFTTLDGSDLDSSCADRYYEEWNITVIGMIEILNAEIIAGTLCLGGEHKFEVVSALASFIYSGSQGSIMGTFKHQLLYNHLRFDEVQYCAYEVFRFLALHQNWGTLPLLPPQPGCPALVLTPFFHHYEDAWECV